MCRTGGRPRRGRGGGAGRKRIERPAKSAADLDAEMEVGRPRAYASRRVIDHACYRITLLVPPPLQLLDMFHCCCNSVYFAPRLYLSWSNSLDSYSYFVDVFSVFLSYERCQFDNQSVLVTLMDLGMLTTEVWRLGVLQENKRMPLTFIDH